MAPVPQHAPVGPHPGPKRRATGIKKEKRRWEINPHKGRLDFPDVHIAITRATRGLLQIEISALGYP